MFTYCAPGVGFRVLARYAVYKATGFLSTGTGLTSCSVSCRSSVIMKMAGICLSCIE